jgi:hypothetical protein
MSSRCFNCRYFMTSYRRNLHEKLANQESFRLPGDSDDDNNDLSYGNGWCMRLNWRTIISTRVVSSFSSWKCCATFTRRIVPGIFPDRNHADGCVHWELHPCYFNIMDSYLQYLFLLGPSIDPQIIRKRLLSAAGEAFDERMDNDGKVFDNILLLKLLKLIQKIYMELEEDKETVVTPPSIANLSIQEILKNTDQSSECEI